MKTKLFVVLAFLLLALVVQAQTYSIDWFTIDGGGGTSTGGVYSVSGTIGQPDAGPAMTGATFTVLGGFWPGAIPQGPHCGSADFNHDTDSGTDLDIEDFFRCIAGNCCATCDSADFNGDGDTATDADIEAFFRVLAGGSC